MRVLVTRAFADAQRTELELAARGHQAIVAPLSEIHLLDSPDPELDDVQAILATSRNGVCAFAHRCGRRDIPVFAVGGNTAAIARSEGFAQVTSAEGDASALVRVIRDALDPSAGVLLHISGRRRTNALSAQLFASGFQCRIWELYDTVPKPELPPHIAADFRAGAIDAVLVLSPESARDLAKALGNAGLETKCEPVLACCISPSAAVALGDLSFGAVRIAEKPTLEDVLALLSPDHRNRAGFVNRERA